MLRIGRDLRIPLSAPAPTPVYHTPPSDLRSAGSLRRPQHSRRVGSGTATGRAVVEEAMKYLGTPYVRGGNSLTRGVDCSGFTKAIYALFGIDLPRTAGDQTDNGKPVEFDQMEPGDLVFFHTTLPGIGHVGIYIGNGEFIQSSSGHGGVVISPIDSGYYNERFVCARRVL